MSLAAAASLALWLGTILGFGGLVVGYRMGRADGRREPRTRD